MFLRDGLFKEWRPFDCSLDTLGNISQSKTKKVAKDIALPDCHYRALSLIVIISALWFHWEQDFLFKHLSSVKELKKSIYMDFSLRWLLSENNKQWWWVACIAWIWILNYMINNKLACRSVQKQFYSRAFHFMREKRRQQGFLLYEKQRDNGQFGIGNMRSGVAG